MFGNQPRQEMLNSIHKNIKSSYSPGMKYLIRNVKSGLCMTVADKNENSYIVQQPKSSSTSQQWEPIPGLENGKEP